MQSDPDISGVHPNYPRNNPLCAIAELLSRYVKPRISHVESNAPGTGQGDMTPEVALASRMAVKEEIETVKKDGGLPIVVLTHLDPKDKVRPEIPPMREELRKMVEAQGVPFVVPDLNDHSMYSGGPHPNAKGNAVIAEALAPVVAKVAGR